MKGSSTVCILEQIPFGSVSEAFEHSTKHASEDASAPFPRPSEAELER